MAEKFNLLKMISGPFTGVFWAKLMMYVAGGGFLFFIGLGLYRGYFKKQPEAMTQNADKIFNKYYQPKQVGIGCAVFREPIELPSNRTITDAKRKP